MPDCDYCDETFEEEDPYLDHLAAEHADELGAIDRRRVDTRTAERGRRTLPLLAAGALAVLLVVGLLAGSYLILGGSGSDDGVQADRTPYGSQHVHGTMSVTIGGEAFDFANDPDLINQNGNFHFHGGSDLWHAHAEGVTLEYALATLGIEVNAGGERLTYEGTTYNDSAAGTEITITVDGEPVDPATYVLRGVGPEDRAAQGDGDDVRVVVETAD